MVGSPSASDLAPEYTAGGRYTAGGSGICEGSCGGVCARGGSKSDGAATHATAANAPTAASQAQRNCHPITRPHTASSAQAIESKRLLGTVLSCLPLHWSGPGIRR
jgi:hypothetical protein